MSSRVVCDASAMVAMLLDSGSDGEWATEHMAGAGLYAPTLLPYECANIIRRQELSRAVSADQAAQAHADLLDLSIDLWPYEALSNRVWELRANLSGYDATYVALAEILAAPLVTLDRRIRRAPGVTCSVAVPGANRAPRTRRSSAKSEPSPH
jgi:predicted nucleic acid-binding protein